jgi:hypothetical protein
MIKELTLQEFKNHFCYNKRRQFLFTCFEQEIKVVFQHCYAFQILIIGSFISEKEKPGDIDIYIRTFSYPSISHFFPKHRKKNIPILPFCDVDNFTDILPIEPLVGYEPEYLTAQEMLKIFNDTNNYNCQDAIIIKEFQKTPTITHIQTTDSDGNNHYFIVNETSFKHKDFEGISYSITGEGLSFHKIFEFTILNVSPERILIYRLNNNFHTELTGKGIVKAMIKKISETTGKIIVSSTNIEHLKIDETEGRIKDVSNYWNKWKKEMSNVDYIDNEDRYVYKPL